MSDKLLQDYKFVAEANSSDQPPVFKVLHKGIEPKVPETLVKYYPLNQYSIDAVTKHQFYVAHPMDFNDPFDCSLYLIDHSTIPLSTILDFLCPPYERRELIDVYRRNRTLVIQRYSVALWNLHFRTMGILSLCNDLESFHLWSYYTNHQGFNLEIRTQLPNNYAGPVKNAYLPGLQMINGEIFENELNALLYNISVKDSFWKHEDEWRYIVISKKNMKIPESRFPIDQEDSIDRLIDYPPEVVKSITLAVRFFAIPEYVPDMDKPTKATLALNDRKSCDRYWLRKTLLDHIIQHKIQTSMMFEDGSDGALTLRRRAIDITHANEGSYWISIFQEA
jgi:hypothetical protein